MSRRAPNPAAERAAQNQATIKSLLKLEVNKICADCKRNKHPRWASWNLGVFICIRCSGIHRGMGTHISRVKSVDLDTWTDEQMQSILSWGNARANKYWEAKLAQGHAPSESKIENFIRTKYELKRWVMDGPKPDPATLDVDGDDDVPLSLVKEKQAIERKESLRKASLTPSRSAQSIAPPEGDLIGGPDPSPTPQRPASTAPTATKVAQKAEPAPPRATSTKDSLLGLDFFGEPSAPPRPASTTGVSSPGGQSRPDLKQSILSLYAKPSRPPPQAQHQSQGSFGGMVSPTISHHSQGSAGGFQDAFSSLSISNTTSPKPAAVDPFANLGSAANTRSTPKAPSSSTFAALSGGGFFDPKPAQPSPTMQQKQPQSSAFGDFGGFASPAPAAAVPQPVQTSSSAMGDLFDLSAPVSTMTTSPPPGNTAPPSSSSVFNLSSPQSKPAAPALTSPPVSAIGGSNISGSDIWGGSEWNTPAPAASVSTAQKSPQLPKSSNDMGWGNSFAATPIIPGASGGFNVAPKVAADEEFGGWASSTGPATGNAKPSGGFGADEDLFSNVWQ